MMNPRCLLSLIICLMALHAGAVPARPTPVTVTQPDGSRLTIVMHGDEWLGYATTTDGYTVVSDASGAMCYATLNADTLAPTPVVAHAPELRTASERAYLATVTPRITPDIAAAQRRHANAQLEHIAHSPKLNTTAFRGLVILVEYTNRSFLFDDPQQLYTDMFNTRGYTGFYNHYIDRWQSMTGSLRDYYSDNTDGRFAPEFDVVGPVKVDYTQTSPNGTSGARAIFRAALRAADSLVDYTRYDANGDSVVDMVFFIVPGGGANMGNNSKYLWPHKWTINDSNLKLDNMKFNVYACSVELFDLEEDNTLDGIGTIAHEFSHVLGVGDLYDTDYANSGGLSSHPGDWSVMAMGCYLNNGCTPAGYGLYERMTMGWANITTIGAERNYSLPPLQTSNAGYRLNIPGVNKEFFLIENRQPVKWDAYLPGHGMLVWRIDSTSTSPYTNGRINANPKHNYVELVRASQRDTSVVESGQTFVVAKDSPADPFPGEDGIHSLLNADTKPNIRSWTGAHAGWVFTDIEEQGQNIYFRTAPDSDTPPAGLIGDLNADGAVNIADLNLLLSILLSSDSPDAAPLADINGDNSINVADINVILNIILSNQ